MTLQTERAEWLQFQRDLQVAVSVADRLRAEAEQALDAVREHHGAAEARLAQALKRQQDSKKVSPSPDRCRLCTSLHDYTNKLHKMSFCTSIVWWLKY